MDAQDDSIDWRLVVLVFAITASVLVVRALSTAASIPLFNDTDDAMRLVEVRDLLAGQNWFDTTQHRLNAPFGASIHWSRLIDAPLAGLMLVFSPLGTGTAEAVAAYVWPLLLLFVALGASAGLAVRLGGREALLPGVLLPAFSLVTLTEFTPGRIDHHSAQIVLTLLLAWCALGATRRPSLAVCAGLAAATALAVGAESLPAVGAAIFAFGIGWIADARLGRSMALFGLSLGGGTLAHFLIAVPAERWLVPACDAISILYVVAATAAGLGLVICAALPLGDRPAWQRLAAGLVVGGCVAIGLAMAFPACLQGPYAALDPWLLKNWIDQIEEAKPLWVALPANPAFLLAAVLPVTLALVTALFQVLRAGGRRSVWLVYLGFLALTALVMLLQVRGARLALPLALPAVAVAISLLRAAYLRKNLIAGAGMLLSWFAGAGLAVGLSVNALAPPAAATSEPGVASAGACRLPQSYVTLAALPPGRVMSLIDLGAHVLAFTPHAVVGAPYHRNIDGIGDSFAFFNATEAEARAIAARRQLGLVVICAGMPELRGLPDAAPDALVRQFAEGRHPGWLLPIETAGPLSIYRVSGL
jgi:hypothetical protein